MWHSMGYYDNEDTLQMLVCISATSLLMQLLANMPGKQHVMVQVPEILLPSWEIWMEF